ncbi:MAG: hypothetical protein WDM94_00165 [Bauldia sp.]
MRKRAAAFVLAGALLLAAATPGLADDTSDFLAKFKHYTIEVKPDPNFDISPLAFDFSNLKLTTRYSGYSCQFSLIRLDSDQPDDLAKGRIAFSDDGHVHFTGRWNTGGMATPETFEETNLAVTEKGLLVGKMTVYAEYTDEGGVPQEPIIANVKVTDGKFGDEAPAGTLVYRLNFEWQAQLNVAGCHK